MSGKRFLDDLFASEGNTWLKVLGCAVVTPVFVGGSLWRAANRNPDGPFTPTAIVTVVVGAAIVGAVIGLLLSLKDTVARRIASDEPCPWVARTLFGRGGLSLAIWFFLVLVTGFIVTMALLSAGVGL